jgi:hypothetical protein
MAFAPITDKREIPSPGAKAEGLNLELKTTILRGSHQCELAKDVSAFANSSGGVVTGLLSDPSLEERFHCGVGGVQ